MKTAQQLAEVLKCFGDKPVTVEIDGDFYDVSTIRRVKTDNHEQVAIQLVIPEEQNVPE